jgi:hypothetical protein
MVRSGNRHRPGRTGIRLPESSHEVREQNRGKYSSEREWRSIKPFRFDFDDVAMVVVPKDGSYFKRLCGEAEGIGIPKTVSIVAWEDLVEH